MCFFKAFEALWTSACFFSPLGYISYLFLHQNNFLVALNWTERLTPAVMQFGEKFPFLGTIETSAASVSSSIIIISGQVWKPSLANRCLEAWGPAGNLNMISNRNTGENGVGSEKHFRLPGFPSTLHTHQMNRISVRTTWKTSTSILKTWSLPLNTEDSPILRGANAEP